MLVDHTWYGGDSIGSTNIVPGSIYENDERFDYTHCVPDADFDQKRLEISEMNGEQHIYYAGAFLKGDSFHEAGVESALECVQRLASTYQAQEENRSLRHGSMLVELQRETTVSSSIMGTLAWWFYSRVVEVVLDYVSWCILYMIVGIQSMHFITERSSTQHLIAVCVFVACIPTMI